MRGQRSLFSRGRRDLDVHLRDSSIKASMTLMYFHIYVIQTVPVAFIGLRVIMTFEIYNMRFLPRLIV